MIPPCDPAILEHNPQFKRLYENLTTHILDYDGSTRSRRADPTRESVAECHDNLAIVSIYLDTPSTAIELDNPLPDTQQQGQNGALSLLAPEIVAFYGHTPTLIQHVSKLLSTAIHDLRAIANTDSNTGSDDSTDYTGRPGLCQDAPAPLRDAQNHISRARARDRRVRTSMAPVAPLSSQLRDRVSNLRRVQLSDLPAARRLMATTAAEVLATQTQVLERTIVILERVKHGALARATKAKAEHLATVAQGVEGKLEVTKLEIAASLHTPETLDALRRYQQHLRNTRESLEDRRAGAIEELKRYGDVETTAETSTSSTDTDGGTMAEIARRYGVLAREVEHVRMEIARLG
ncbi:hypothetical protein N7492_003014 [Penicillium capsulatum]|uniref:Uncharacterized protein n=1 Tax=Penicillium capsulatum TaxID=69766 RepID=A0A9W9IIU1_9EURO|nr:hypothetical protein N7492_003014 [Penicillium capsulatum]KAJ6122395.1 hypothetical protein N7512_004860 [Penicillium capsulatum]